MKIGIFGLGYVGLTTAACLLRRGYEVIGYETSGAKRDELAKGRVPLSEPGVEPAIQAGLADGRFRVRAQVSAEETPGLLLIAVGTPSDETGATNLTAVHGVFSHLADHQAALLSRGSEIVLRSTVPPGTLQAFSRKFPELFNAVSVAFYPEFLREGTAIHDFEHPPQTVIGAVPGSPPPAHILSVIQSFGFSYRLVDAVTAESLKFACNAFHALKVCFANEMGRLATSLGANPAEVMELFVNDTQLNISKRYLRPGAPFGGSCLPKDTRSIRHLSTSRGVQLPTIGSCEESNQAHFAYIVERILALYPQRLAILGLAFKRDTDDIRESPTVEILYRLAARGDVELRVHDFLVRPETAIGVNQRLLEKLIALPSIFFSNQPAEVLVDADAVLIMHPDERYDQLTAGLTIPVLNVARWSGMSLQAPRARLQEIATRVAATADTPARA